MDVVPAAVHVADLTFAYGGGGGTPVLRDINLTVLQGTRNLLIGINGTGKSTLLRIMAGKHMVAGDVRVLGKDAYRSTPAVRCDHDRPQRQGLTYLGAEWAHMDITRSDIGVTRLVEMMGGSQYAERRDVLMELMDVNPDWHMHQISDGERRRVQLVLGLIKPFTVLLLDEVTVDLDVLVRRDLLDFLRRETDERHATIIYATHIFDGLGDWASHLIHLSNGTVSRYVAVGDVPELQPGGLPAGVRTWAAASPLLGLVETWLREEYEYKKRTRRAAEAAAKPQTRLEMLREDDGRGDKYYDYWAGPKM